MAKAKKDNDKEELLETQLWGMGDIPRIYGLSMEILFKQNIKKP